MSLIDIFKQKNCYVICDSDLDGVTASILSDWFIKPIAKSYTRYNTGDRKLPDFNWEMVKNSDIVLFVDIAPYSLDMVNKIKETCELVICDHHETSKKDLGELDNYFYSTEKCASKIFYEELTRGIRVKKVISQMVELTNIYDLYQIESQLWRNAKGFSNILYQGVNWAKARYQTDSEKYQFFIDIQLRKIETSKEFYFTAKEKEWALKAEEKERKNYAEAKKSLKIRQDNQGNKYAYFECSSKLSWTASLLLREYPNIKYFVGHATFLENYRHEENGKLSLRSQKDFDISGIAQLWKGGGHSSASGLELSIENFKLVKEGKLHLI